MPSLYRCCLTPIVSPASQLHLKSNIVLREGINFVGRNEMGGCESLLARVSRKQLVCAWDPTRGELRAGCGRDDGKEACFLQPANVGLPAVKLPYEASGMAVVPVDQTVTLYLNHAPFSVDVQSEEPEFLFSKEYNNPGKAAAKPGPGLAALRTLMADLRKILKSGTISDVLSDPRVFYCDAKVVLVYDAYPKGTVHLLGFLLAEDVKEVDALRPVHIEALKHLHSVCNAAVQHIGANPGKKSGYAQMGYQIGYHATPSLQPLHVHVMTTDVAVPCLKNRKHYESFCPPHFIPADSALRRLEGGKVGVTQAERATPKGKLSCRWCGEELANLPGLKRHLLAGCEGNPNRFQG